MKRLLLLSFFAITSLALSAQVCNPDPSYANAGPGVYPFSIATPDCSDTLGVKTIVSITDTTVSFTQPITLDVTIYYDSSRVLSVTGLPPGLSFGTDVDANASAHLPYGAWVNSGTIPNVTPAVGCVYVHGNPAAWQAAQLGGDTGVYTLAVEYDARIVQTDPDVSAFGVPNGTWLSDVDPSFGGGSITINVPMDTDPITDLTVPVITGNASASIWATETYTTTAGAASYDWTVVGGTIQSGQGTDMITVVWDGNIEENSVTVEVGDGEGCTKSQTSDVTVLGVGIDELEALGAEINPNPSNGIFNLVVKDADPVSVRILDLAGKAIQTENLFGSTRYSLNMESAPAGLYILELETKKGRAFSRLIKN